MSPVHKHLALFSVLGILTLAIYYYPLLLYITLTVVFFYIVLNYHGVESLPARLGLNPRTRANIQSVLRRWSWAWGVSNVSVPLKRRAKFNSNKSKVPCREQEGFTQTGPYRRDALTSDSLLFSPRDLLMGSYIAKTDSPPALSHRARAPRNPRETLRENLSRPNHAVYTPNRRLSFTGELPGSGSRFTITPQRHYPLQQQGASPVGVLPPVRWDGFRQKSILSPRNTSVSSPVTVKIARPDCSSPSLEHLGSSVYPKAEVDPCSRESVLKVLRESRKREVEDEDRRFSTEQRSKRRRNDSGGSAQSAFEPLLPNGTSTQLIPKPGSLKRALVASEDQSVKRSRTSSVSSVSGGAALRGTPGSRRNPISSSYSSSQGLGQWKRPAAAASPLSSPGSSRSNTPVGTSKKPRQDDGLSPSAALSVESGSSTEQLPVLDKSNSALKHPATGSTESAENGGKRKRKIQLVSREDHLSLPPPPELGYSITVKDLDEEKQTALDKIQKILETPAPEPEPASSGLPSSVTFSSALITTASSTAGTGISTFPNSALSTMAGTALATFPTSTLSSSVGTGDSTGPSLISVSTTPAQVNILLESLKRKSPPAVSSVPALTTATAQGESSGSLKTTVPASSLLVTSASTPVVAPATAASEKHPAPAPGLFSLLTTASSSTATTTAAAACSTTPLLSSGFKPIFNVSTTPSTTDTASKPPVQTFKPIFGTASESSVSAPASTASTASVFGQPSCTTSAPLVFTAATVSTTVSNSSESGVKPAFGSWSAPSTSAQSNSSSTLQFGSALTTTAGANTSSSSQPGLTFGQPTSTQSSTTASFGGFGNTATTSQSTFTFGKSSVETNSAPSFSATTEPPKPFPFGATTSTPALNSAPFTFGQAVPTTASTFGTPVKPTFAFGSSTAAAGFGHASAAQSSSTSTFTFGSSAPQPPTSNAQPTSTPFKFGAAAPCPQFGTPVANNATPQMGAFNFSSNTTDKPSFGTSNPGFGQTSTPAPIPFGSPGTPGQGFSAVPFGSPATPSFSIGAGSKPSAARQRLQARRQHTRKK